MGINEQINHFFREFPDNRRNIAFWGMICMFLLFLDLVIYSNIRNDPDITFACTMYGFFLLVTALVASVDKLREGGHWMGMVIAGKWNYFGLIPMVIGMTFGWFMVSQNQTIGLSFLQLSGTNAFLFIVVIAPLAEEWFFRCIAFPSLYRQLQVLNVRYYGMISLIGISGLFGLFHWYVYGANLTAIYVAIFLGIIYTIGNYWLKSGTFSIGAHMANNYLLWAAAGGMLG